MCREIPETRWRFNLSAERKPLGGEAGEAGTDDFSFGSLDVVFDTAELDGVLVWPVDDVAGTGIPVAGLADGAHIHENLPAWRQWHDIFPCPLGDLPAGGFLPPERWLVGMATEREM
jgi:hypothetical protein